MRKSTWARWADRKPRATPRRIVRAGSLAVLSAVGWGHGPTAVAAGEDPASVVATQLRAQGYACKNPKSAERDERDSRPDATAWIVDCGDAVYRIRLIPHRAAEVEIVPPPPPPPPQQ
jgi:hypothetical protein